MRAPTLRTVLLILAAGVMLTLGGCAAGPSVDRGGPDPALRGQWELLSAKDAGGSITLSNQLITLTIASDATTSGRSACTDYTARIYGNPTQLWVTATLPRAEHCGIQAQQDIEQRYITDLNRVRAATVDRSLLDLTAPGIDLKYQRATRMSLAEITGKTWALASVSPDSYYGNQDPQPVFARGATILFAKDGTVTALTGCHLLTAHYAQDAGQIVVDHLVTRATGSCNAEDAAVDHYVVSVVTAGFTILPGKGAFAIASPRAEIALGFITETAAGG